MTRPLEDFCERELEFIADEARAFAERYPAEAKHLTPEPNRHIDPHLERFIEGFALLAGRINHKIDSEFPELTESLLQVLYPHLGLVIPSMAIAQAEVDEPFQKPCHGWRLEKDTLVRSKPFVRSGKYGETCQYQVGYPLTVWPIDLTEATWETGPFDTALDAPAGTKSILRLRFSCRDGLSWDDLSLDRLRLYLNGERQLIAGLYEILFNRCLGGAFASVDEEGRRPRENVASAFLCPASPFLFQVGLALDEGMLPFPPESFVGHRLLMELLSFPQKFLFVDLAGWERLRGHDFGSHVEVSVFVSHTLENLERGLSAQNFLLNCTPVVNLFRKSAEPIDCNHLQPSYRVVPTRVDPLAMEVYRVEAVQSLGAASSQELRPFYANQRTWNADRGDWGAADNSESANPQAAPYWYAHRRASTEKLDPGTEVYLTVVDPRFRPDETGAVMLDVETWCTNRDLPNKLQQAGDRLYLASDRTEARARLKLLNKPTPPLRPALRRETHSRILGQLYLNHVSLSQGNGAVEALREMLRLCDFSGPATRQLADVNQQIIDGIRSVRSRAILQRIRRDFQWGLCQGTQFEVEFDEQNYVGTSVFLVASVLDRFLGLYTAVNSFTQLVAKTAQAEGVLKIWPARAGAEKLE